MSFQSWLPSHPFAAGMNHAQQQSAYQRSVAHPAAGHFFDSPLSTTGYGYQNAAGKVAMDVNAPGKYSHLTGAPSGYGLSLPNGMSARDAAFFMKTAGAKNELQKRLIPFNSQLAELQAGGYGQYNSQLGFLKSQLGNQVSQSSAQMGAHGFSGGGMQINANADLGKQFALQQDALSRQLGPLAADTITRQIADQRQTFSHDLYQYLLTSLNNKRSLATAQIGQ